MKFIGGSMDGKDELVPDGTYDGTFGEAKEVYRRRDFHCAADSAISVMALKKMTDEEVLICLANAYGPDPVETEDKIRHLAYEFAKKWVNKERLSDSEVGLGLSGLCIALKELDVARYSRVVENAPKKEVPAWKTLRPKSPYRAGETFRTEMLGEPWTGKETVECIGCGKKFRPTFVHQIWCPECALEEFGTPP